MSVCVVGPQAAAGAGVSTRGGARWAHAASGIRVRHVLRGVLESTRTHRPRGEPQPCERGLGGTHEEAEDGPDAAVLLGQVGVAPVLARPKLPLLPVRV